MSTALATKPAAPAVEKMAFKLSETAKALSMSEITVRRLVDKGMLKPCRAVRHLLFSRAEIERFLAQ